jgi:hypothetical protein
MPYFPYWHRPTSGGGAVSAGPSMTTTLWTPGTLAASYVSCFNAADLNSLAAGSSVLSSVAAFNNSMGDTYGVLTFKLGTLTPTGGTPFIAFDLYPQNQDTGSVYGDGSLTAGSQVAATLNGSYSIPNVTIQQGTTIVPYGTSLIFPLPPFTSFAFACYNGFGTPFNSSGNVGAGLGIFFKSLNLKQA